MTQLTDVQQMALDLAHAFFEAKERHDLDATMAVFADDADYVFPLSNTGDPEPWFFYRGKAEVAEYQRGVLERFSQIRMLDAEYTVGPEGDVVFVTSRGDYVAADGGTPYRNVYSFRFRIADGVVVRVDEYANSVTYAKLAGLPLG